MRILGGKKVPGCIRASASCSVSSVCSGDSIAEFGFNGTDGCRLIASRRVAVVSIFWTLFPVLGHAHALFRPKHDKMVHIVDKMTHIAGILAHRAAGTARSVHRVAH